MTTQFVPYLIPLKERPTVHYPQTRHHCENPARGSEAEAPLDRRDGEGPRQKRGSSYTLASRLSPRPAQGCTARTPWACSVSSGKNRGHSGRLLSEHHQVFPRRPTWVSPHRDYWGNLRRLGRDGEGGWARRNQCQTTFL